MPRESERSSSTVSRAWRSAASIVSAARSRVLVELLAGPAQVHRESHQALLGTVVDVALQPAQRRRLGDAGGVSATLDPGDLLLELGAAAQDRLGEAAVQQGHRRGPRTAG